MKKIALMSFIESMNYGATLQTYALEKYLEATYKDIFFEYIRYVRPHRKSSIIWLGRKILYSILRKDDTPSWSIQEYLNIVTSMIFKKNNSNMIDNEKLFQKFWMLSKYSSYITKKELLNKKLDYDMYIIGSDQVWNCGRLNLDTTFLLDFVELNEKKASYAPSLGLKKIPEKYRKEYKKYLSAFRYLSCREKNGAKVIQELIGKEVQVVLDPVFLLTSDEWRSVEDSTLSMVQKKEFVVAYMLDESEVLYMHANNYTKDRDLDIICIYGDMSKNKHIGPTEWLWYMRNAQMIFTNSFHGTAFAIIFNVPFWVEVPNKEFFQDSSDRIFDVLKMFELEERIIEKFDIKTNNEKLFERVNEILNIKRKESTQYINMIVREE